MPSLEHERAIHGFEGRYETSVTVDVCCLNMAKGANVLASTATMLRLKMM